eukprot:3307233-Rhodomonas_salina.2
MAAARMAAEEFSQPTLATFKDSADDLRRRGEGVAAMMAYRKTNGAKLKSMMSQYPFAYSAKKGCKDKGGEETFGNNFGFLEITRG